MKIKSLGKKNLRVLYCIFSDVVAPLVDSQPILHFWHYGSIPKAMKLPF